MQPVTPRALCGGEHAILRLLAREFFPARTRTRARARARLVVLHISRQKIVNPISRALAHDICVVRRWNEADRLSGASV